jgi:hypothetical protein
MSEEEVIKESGCFWKDGQGIICSRYFALALVIVAFIALLCIPFKIISQGYLPIDDALRHAGFAVSGKTLDAVMVSDGPISDTHLGWHAMLRFLHQHAGLATTDEVVVFEMAFLALFFLIPPLFMVKRSEGWVIALLLAYNFLGFGLRLFFGRPFIASMALLTWILLLRDQLNEKKIKWSIWGLLYVGMTLSIWWRMTGFLYLVPIVTFAAARQWRIFYRLLILLVVSTITAILLCGDWLLPFEIFKAVLSVLDSAEGTGSLVGELQPLTTFMNPILVVLFVCISAKLRGGEVMKKLDSPVFFIFAGSCFLSSGGVRWFAEFGVVALLIMMLEELQAWLDDDRLQRWFAWFSFPRFAIAMAAIALLFVGFTADQGSRWSSALKREYVEIDDPDIQGGLPGSDGIIYSSSMGVFFQTFFRYPNAPWKYMLGCEAAVMPEEDLQILRKIQWNREAWVSFEPWVKKMRPQDRMWIETGFAGSKPGIEGLEWTKMTSYIWSGRKIDESLDDSSVNESE